MEEHLAHFMIEEVLHKNAQILIHSGFTCKGKDCVNQPHENIFFIKEMNGKYRVRYLKYVESENKLSLLIDTTFYDGKCKWIFEIESQYRDSILSQISNMGKIFAIAKVGHNGQNVYANLRQLKVGKLRMLLVIYADNLKIIASEEIIPDLNQLFEKAYHYWLLQSAINNYIRDNLLLFGIAVQIPP